MEKTGTFALSVLGLIFYFSYGIVASSGNFQNQNASNAVPPFFCAKQVVPDGLPTPPVPVSETYFSSGQVLINRDPSALRQNHIYQPNSLSIKNFEMFVCPEGMQNYWDLIEAEISLQSSKERAEAVSNLLQIIVKDDYKAFMDYTPEFERVFEKKINEVLYYDRTISVLLILFGGFDIMRHSSELIFGKETTVSRTLGEVFTFITTNRSFAFLGSMVDLVPEILDIKLADGKSFLYYVSITRGHSMVVNLAYFFANVAKITPKHIGEVIYILPQGQNLMAELINFSQQLITYYRNNSGNFSNVEQFIFKYRQALQLTISICVTDYALVEPGTRFTFASLFIDYENVDALRRLLTESPGILDVLPNGKTLLQIALDGCKYESAALIADMVPGLILSVSNGFQSPFAQLHYHPASAKLNKIYTAFLRKAIFSPAHLITIFDDEQNPTKSVQLNAFTLAITTGRLDLLKVLVEYFQNDDGYYINWNYQIGTALKFLSERLEAEKAAGKFTEYSALINDDIWDYFMTHSIPFCLENFKSMLDLAVINRSTLSLHKVITKYQADSRKELKKGHCFEYLRSDMHGDVFKILIRNGLDVDRMHEIGGRKLPLICHLLNLGLDQDRLEYLQRIFESETLKQKTIDIAKKYGEKHGIKPINDFFKAYTIPKTSQRIDSMSEDEYSTAEESGDYESESENQEEKDDEEDESQEGEEEEESADDESQKEEDEEESGENKSQEEEDDGAMDESECENEENENVTNNEEEDEDI